MDEYEGHPSVLVADVDCTAAGQELCQQQDVQGYPTIKWGEPSDLKDYQGGRSFEDIKAHAEEHLKPLCGPSNLDLCDDEKKAEIVALQALGKDALNKKIEEQQEKIVRAERQFERKKAKLQRDIDKAERKMNRKIKKVKQVGGLGLMKAVQAAGAKEDEAAKAKAKEGRPLTWEEKAAKMEAEMDEEEEEED